MINRVSSFFKFILKTFFNVPKLYQSTVQHQEFVICYKMKEKVF
jgi:hypothetical protein